MIQRTRAIFLRQTKYSETSLVITCYTEFAGRQSYIINGIRSSKSKMKCGVLQPLFLLELETQNRATREVQRIKEYRLSEIYSSIPFDVVKSSIALFLSEILFKLLQSEDPDPELFEFMYNSFDYFDTLDKGTANFHLWFLASLAQYIGFKPQNNYTPDNCWFDPHAGCFNSFKAHYPASPDMEESALLSQLFDLKADELHLFQIDGGRRSRLLNILSDFYSFHFEGIGKINSLSILSQIFSCV